MASRTWTKAVPAILAVIIIACSLAVVAPSSAQALSPVYVRTNGSDSNDGSADDATHALKTIQAAVNAVDVGDIIHVASGTYSENVTISTANVQLLGETGAVIDGGGTGNCVLVHANGVTVDGFELTNGYCGILADLGTSGSTFSNNVIHNNVNAAPAGCVGAGINLWGDCDNNVVSYNRIYSNDRQGVFIGFDPAKDATKLSTGNTVEHNWIYNNGQYTVVAAPDRSNYGVQFWYAHGNQVTDNEIYGQSQPSLTGFADVGIGVYLCQADGNTVSGNNIHDNRIGVAMFDCGAAGGCASNAITSNTITGCSLYGFRLYNDAETTTFGNNDLSGNATAIRNTDTERLVAGDNWWGSLNGPTHASNTFNVGSQGVVLAPAGSDNIAFVPWLDATPPAGGSFAPVTTISPAGSHSSIQAGVDASNPGGMILAAPGSYAETLTFGPAFSTSGLTITAASLTDPPVISGGVIFQNTDEVSGLTLEGFYLRGCSPAYHAVVAMRNSGAVRDLVIANCVVDGENVPEREGIYGANLTGTLTVTGNEFKDILGWAVLDSEGGGGVGYGSRLPLTEVTFADNYVHDCNGSVALRGLVADPTPVVDAYGNRFSNLGGNQEETGEQWAALEINGAETANVYDNYVEDVQMGAWGEGQALQLFDIATLDVHDNVFVNCYQGIWVYGGVEGYSVPGGRIYDNVIAGHSEYGLNVDSLAPGGRLDATGNWWGHASGPLATGNADGQGNSVSGNVSFAPWDTGRLQVSAPARVLLGRTTAVTVRLTLSDGTDIKVPVPVTFTATGGSLVPNLPVMTVDGVATASWTTGAREGPVDIAASAAGLEATVRVWAYEPAPREPAPSPATTGGFTAESEDGTVTVEVPKNISDVPIKLTVAPSDDSPPTGGNLLVGHVFDVEMYVQATGSGVHDLRQSLTIVFHVSAADLAAAGVTDPSDLRIWYWDVDAEPPCWVALPTVYDPVAGTLTVTVDHLTTFAAMVDPGFPALADTSGHWAEEDILRLASLGVVEGYEDGSFRPEVAVTRAQFAKFIVLSLGLTKGTALPAGFADAASVQAWAVPYVSACLRDEIMTGAGELIRPNDTITRAEASAMVVRALGLLPQGGGVAGPAAWPSPTPPPSQPGRPPTWPRPWPTGW